MDRNISRLPVTLLLGCLAMSCLAMSCAFSSIAMGREQGQITVSDFMRIVSQFVAKHDLPRNAVISHKDVLPLLGALESQGMIFDRKELLHMIPTDESSLVRLLRTQNGRKFIGQTSKNKLMFDRLERILNERGGERLLRDLMKLPDAARYAKIDTGPGVPDLVDFLPKTRSGKTRRVKDYNKPTGQLYTFGDVIDYLAKQVSSSRKSDVSK